MNNPIDVFCFKQIYKHIKNIKDIYSFAQCSKATLKIYRESNVWRLTTLVQKPQQKIQVFINYFKYLPKQGSAEWKRIKEGADDVLPVLGGSEIGTILGLNPYSKTKQLIASKLK